MSNDLYLKFASEEEANEVLYITTESYVNEEGLPVYPDAEGSVPEGAIVKTDKRPKFINTDVIGDIYKPTGETTTVEGPEEGEEMEVPVLEKLEGYHVNIRPMPDEDVSELEEFAITPKNPVRVWA